MAIEILSTYVAHDVRHDLESFFWLLLWIVLRYTKTTCWPPYEEYISVFGGQTEKQSAIGKVAFLVDTMEWEVVDNKPLTMLVRRFKDLCKSATPYAMPAQVPLTYESVVALFDEALARPDWPQNDHALPFKMPPKTLPTEGESQAAMGSRGGQKRPEPEPDPLSLPAHKRVHIYRPPPDDALDYNSGLD